MRQEKLKEVKLGLKKSNSSNKLYHSKVKKQCLHTMLELIGKNSKLLMVVIS